MNVGQIYYNEKIDKTLVITCVDEIYCSWVTSEGKVCTDKQTWVMNCCKPVAQYSTWQEAVNSFEFNRYTEFSDLGQESLKLKQKIEDIRTVIVDIFDKDTEYGDVDLCYDALIRIEKILRECGL